MSEMLLLAGVSGALIVAGLVVAVAALVPSDAPPRPPLARRSRRWRAVRSAGDGQSLAGRRRLQLQWAAAAAAGSGVWVASGWPVGGAAVAVTLVGVPWLLRQFSAANAQIDRLEALQEWVRRTSDVIAAGGGLEQTLIRSARTAPTPIRGQVQTLTARLQARWPTQRALLAFADDLDDAAGDLVVAALMLGAELRGPGLARVLTELARSLTEEVTMRRKIEADRAKPRANARWLLLITFGAVAVAALNGDYITPYGTPVGQLALAAIAGMIAGCLLWMRKLTLSPPTPRFLVDSGGRTTADVAEPATVVGGRR